MDGIKEECENNLPNQKEQFDLQAYIRFFANHLRFSEVRQVDVDNPDDFIKEISQTIILL